MRKTRTAWSLDDENYLKENYGKKSINDIMLDLNRPQISIRTKANMLNLYISRGELKTKIVLENYKNLCNTHKTNEEIAETLGVGISFLYKIKKDHKIKVNPVKSRYGTRWTKYEINKLKVLYTSNTTKECAIILNRTFESVKTKLKQHKIRK